MNDFAGELQRLMAAQGLGVRELARQVPCNPGYISNLRGGRKRPSSQTARRLDEILGAGGTLVVLAGREGAQPGAAGSGSPLEELADHTVEFGRWTEATNVGTGTIDLADAEIHHIAREYGNSPPGPLVRRAAQVSRRVFALVRQHQRLWQTRDLYVIGAKSCAFLACALGDLGQQPAAAAHGRTALTLAEESGHPAAVALALSALSKIAFWDGERERASDLARRGYECCPPSSTRVLLACQEADAADLPGAREAISRAGRAHDEITADDDLAGLFSCGRARRACYTMTLRLRIGDPAGVLAAAEDADAAYKGGEKRSHGTWGQVQISAALAYLGMGEIDAAAARLSPVLGLPPALRLATFGGRLAQTAGMLAAPAYRGNAAAGDLADEVHGYLRVPEAGRLPYPLALGRAGWPQ